MTVRRTQTAPRESVPFEFVDTRTVRLLPDGALPEPGAIYELHYDATKPRVLGIGFAATRDLVSHLRRHGDGVIGRTVTHTLAFGISQAGRYLRDHIAQGFNRGRRRRARVRWRLHPCRRHRPGVPQHAVRASRSAPAPGTRTTTSRKSNSRSRRPRWPIRSAAPAAHCCAATRRDPKLIETNTSTEYWQKGASLLHTDPLGTQDVALPANVRGYLLAGTQHGGKAGMPRDKRALRQSAQLARSDGRRSAPCWSRWTNGWRRTARRPPAACRGSTDGTLVAAEAVALPDGARR